MRHAGAVLLAAGCSSRFGTGNKLLAEIGGKPMVRVVADTLVGSACFDEMIVVTGHEAEAVAHALKDLPVRCVFNANWRDGMGTSIAVGIARLSPSTKGAVIALGDMPFLDRALIERLVSTFFEHDGTSIVIPTTPFGGQRNPVMWPRRFFVRLENLRGQEGGKILLKDLTRSCVALPVTDERPLVDIDDRTAFDQAHGEPGPDPLRKALQQQQTRRRTS